MTSTLTENPYETLGVSPYATDNEIKSAWRTLIRSVHPDLSGDILGDEAKQINAAYSELKNPARRALVDAELRQAGTAAQPATVARPSSATRQSRPADSKSTPRPRSPEAEEMEREHVSLFTRRGLSAFVLHDRIGQWLIALAWFAFLGWMFVPFYRLDTTTAVFLALAGLLVQALVARRFAPSPLHDLAQLTRVVVVGVTRLTLEAIKAALDS